MRRGRPADLRHGAAGLPRSPALAGGPGQDGGSGDDFGDVDTRRMPTPIRRRLFRLDDPGRRVRAVPAGLDPTDTILEPRVCGEHGGETRGQRLGEKHVTGLCGVGTGDARSFHEGPDPLERTGDGARISCELHGRGIGQVLALTADGGLDEVSEQRPHEPHDREPRAKGHYGDDPSSLFAPAAAAARPGEGDAPQDEIPDDADDQDAVEDSDQADVQAHVPIEDVAELVRDHSLQLGAGQLLDGSLRHSDHSVVGCVSSCKRVDPLLARHQVDGWHRRAGGDRHLFDNVQDLALLGIRGVARDETATESFGDHPPTAPELRHLVQTSARDDGHRRCDDGQEQPRVPKPCLLRLRREKECDADHYIDRHDDRHDRQHEEKHQAAGFLARSVLTFEKIHALQLNETLGASCIFALSSNSSSDASWLWPNIPAKITGGNVCL